MPRQLEIRIDREACHGTGGCVMRAPAFFRLDESGKASSTGPRKEGDEAALQGAADACPYFAIEILRIGEASE